MRVAQFVEGDAPGGTERLVIQMAHDLRARGHDVLVVGPQNGPGKGWLGGQLRAAGFEWVELPRRKMLDVRAISDIMDLLRERRIDVLHSHEFAPSVTGAVAAWLMKRPHVMTMHGNRYYAGAWRRWLSFRWAATHSTAVVAVSRDTGADAEKQLRLRPGSIKVIPNGIVTRPGNRERVRRELGVADSELLVVALGNVSVRKAHSVMLRALIALRERRPDIAWRLAIAGTDQGCATELRNLAEVHGVSERFHLLGHRGDTDDILAASDVFAMSSLHEGMPLAIMEAMFAGKPVVTSSAGGIGEMMTDGVDGLLTPVGDADAMSIALERVLTDARLRESLGRAAQLRAPRQFGIAPMMDAYLDFYGDKRRANGRR